MRKAKEIQYQLECIFLYWLLYLLVNPHPQEDQTTPRQVWIDLAEN